MSDSQHGPIIKLTESPQGTIIKGGEIQVLNTSGTTTVTQEMANLVIPPTQIKPKRPGRAEANH